MTVAAVRAELVTKLKAIGPLSGRAYGYQPDSLQVPCAFVGTTTYNPRAAFDIPDLSAEVWVAVSRAASAERGVETLDSYVDGVNDVVAALEAAGAAWDSLVVTSVEFPVTIPVGSGEYLAARYTCEVML